MIRALALFLVLILLTSAACAADVGVSPPRIDITVPVGGAATTSFNVIWSGKDPVRLDVSKSDWTMASDGNLVFLPEGEGDHSAASWLTLQAGTVSMAGAGQTTMRVSVQVPDDSSLAGTYNAVLFVETPPQQVNGTQTNLATRQRVGVVVYVTIAGTERGGSKLTDLFSDGTRIHAIVSNVGNTLMRYSGTLEVRDVSGSTIDRIQISDGAILRESERDIAIKMPDLPKGYYVLLLLLKDSRGGLLTGQLPYEVK